MIVDRFPGRLVVTPDNSTPGSEGRLCLLFPAKLTMQYGGKKFRAIGHLATDKALMFAAHENGNTITEKGVYWWKNGVRDHGIRENYNVWIWSISESLFVVELVNPTGEPKPDLPPFQPTLFG
jgi:hypothetical protein